MILAGDIGGSNARLAFFTIVSSEAQHVVARSKADLLIEPRLENIGLLEWKAFDAAVEAGYRHTMRFSSKTRVCP